MKVLMIIPAYNEENSIIRTCNIIKDKVSNDKFILDYVVINDGSVDSTKERLEKNNENYIDLVCNLGIGGAVQTGYKYALKNDYDVAIQFDGDGQHDINYIEDLINPIINGDANFSIGSRFVGNESDFKSTRLRRVGIGFLSNLIKICTKTTIKDATSGFRAADKNVIKIFAEEYPKDYPEPESIITLLKNRYIIKEVPVNMHERYDGKSSINAMKSLYYMFKVSLSIFIANLSIRRSEEEDAVNINS